MRIALIHNDDAGSADYKTKDLKALFRSLGHKVQTFGIEKGDLRQALRSKVDVIVVAGGDGTVASVVLAAHKDESKIPLYVLPIGTANNIARTLGLSDDVPELAFALDKARRIRFDIGVVKTRKGKERFVEAAGFGFIGTMLERDNTIREKLGRAKRKVTGLLGPKLSEQQKANRGVARLIREQRAIETRVHADDEDLSGEYVAVEVMNIREIGPHVGLAPNATPDDKRFDLLLVPPEEREALADYVEAGSVGTPPGIRRRVKRVELDWPGSAGHVDDETWPCEGNGDEGKATKVRVKRAGRVEVLVPAKARPSLDT